VRQAEDLLLAAVSCQSDEAAHARLAGLVAGGVDWDLVLRLSRRHGVTPLLSASLSDDALRQHIPSAVATALGEAVMRATAAVLLRERAMAESAEALEAAGHQPLVIRGPVVAHEFYDRPALRPSSDIDILVPAERWPQLLDDLHRWQHTLQLIAFRVAGWRREMPACIDPARLSDASFRCWLQRACTPWCIETVGPHSVMFEFHFSLFPDATHGSGDSDLRTKAQPVQLPGATVRTLRQPELLIELCLHAITHYAWGTRLIWFCDIDRVVRIEGPRIDWPGLFECAAQLGADVPVYYALKLAMDLLGAPVPPDALASAQPPGLRARRVARTWPQYLRPLLRRAPPGCPSPYQWATDPLGALTTRFGLRAAAELLGALWPSKECLYLRYGVSGAVKPYLYRLVHLARAPAVAAAARRTRRW
jgi:predicted nucleotidyltransferase